MFVARNDFDVGDCLQIPDLGEVRVVATHDDLAWVDPIGPRRLGLGMFVVVVAILAMGWLWASSWA